LNKILTSTGFAVDNFQHCANVTSLSLSLAGRLGVKDTQIQLDLGLGALLHDLGYSKIGLDPNIPRSKYTKEQLKLFHMHPQAGVDAIAGKRYITPHVLALVSAHEEIGEGAGFPEKKRLFNMDIEFQILSLCNEYDRYVRELKISPIDGIKKFMTDKMGLFELEHIKLLGVILKET